MTKKVGGVRGPGEPALRTVTPERFLISHIIEGYGNKLRHRREGIRLPELSFAHLEEAAHHLALAVCQHMGSPCTFCCGWADLAVFASATEKTNGGLQRKADNDGGDDSTDSNSSRRGSRKRVPIVGPDRGTRQADDARSRDDGRDVGSTDSSNPKAGDAPDSGDSVREGKARASEDIRRLRRARHKRKRGSR